MEKGGEFKFVPDLSGKKMGEITVICAKCGKIIGTKTGLVSERKENISDTFCEDCLKKGMESGGLVAGALKNEKPERPCEICGADMGLVGESDAKGLCPRCKAKEEIEMGERNKILKSLEGKND